MSSIVPYPVLRSDASVVSNVTLSSVPSELVVRSPRSPRSPRPPLDTSPTSNASPSRSRAAVPNLTHRKVPAAKDYLRSYCKACTFEELDVCPWCFRRKLSHQHRFPIERVAAALLASRPALSSEPRQLVSILARYARNDEFAHKLNYDLGWKDSEASLCDPHQIRHEAWLKEREDMAAAMEREKKALADRVEELEATLFEREAAYEAEVERLRNSLPWVSENVRLEKENLARGVEVDGVLRENARLQEMLERVALLSNDSRASDEKQQADHAKAVGEAGAKRTHASASAALTSEAVDSAHARASQLLTAHRKISQILDFAAREPKDELRLGKEDEAHEDVGTEGDEGRGDSSSLEVQQQHRLWQRIKSSMHTDADEAELDERLRLIDVIAARERRVAQLEEIRKRAEAAEAARRNELASEKVQLSSMTKKADNLERTTTTLSAQLAESHKKLSATEEKWDLVKAQLAKLQNDTEAAHTSREQLLELLQKANAELKEKSEACEQLSARVQEQSARLEAHSMPTTAVVAIQTDPMVVEKPPPRKPTVRKVNLMSKGPFGDMGKKIAPMAKGNALLEAYDLLRGDRRPPGEPGQGVRAIQRRRQLGPELRRV